jgi:hypothetical protein
VREKIVRHVDGRAVRYTSHRWMTLASLRARAAAVQRALPGRSMVYGSVARGDVRDGSDVDVVLVDGAPSFAVELSLESRFHIVERRITLASPSSVPKAHVVLDEGSTVSWPLLAPSEREEAFHAFGGWLDAAAAGPRDRVPGVSKRLLLVEPTPEGHVESSVVGSEVAVARRLRVPLDVVLERVRVLGRRDRVGRTGVFKSVPVPDGESLEQALDGMGATSPAVRHQLQRRQGP